MKTFAGYEMDVGKMLSVNLYLNLMELVALSASEISEVRSVMMMGRQ